LAILILLRKAVSEFDIEETTGLARLVFCVKMTLIFDAIIPCVLLDAI
jgi:hypothetical protein